MISNECIGKPSVFGICTDMKEWYFTYYSKEIEEDPYARGDAFEISEPL